MYGIYLLFTLYVYCICMMQIKVYIAHIGLYLAKLLSKFNTTFFLRQTVWI